MAEEEFAEYLLWLEAERLRSRAVTPKPRATATAPAGRLEGPPPEPIAA